MQLPAALISDIRQGLVVLFFGAGASADAVDATGRKAPLGNQLRDMLSDEFLGGQFKTHPLGFVADLAISESDLYRVQDFIADQFKPLLPPEYLQLLPTFRWRGLASTNYDIVIEQAYSTTPRPVQQVVPFLSDDDRVEERIRSSDQVGLLKLHGCVTRTHDQRIPLILTLDQYAEARKNRELVYRMFEGWAFEGPVVFIGHGLQDPDLRAILTEISKHAERRPRYFLVRPDASDEETRFWETKRITVLPGTLQEFLTAIDRAIPAALRPLLQAVDNEHPVRARFKVNEPVGSLLQEFFRNDVEYVHSAMAVGNGNAQAFYRGFDQGWYPIDRELDVRRSGLTDTILNEVIIRPEDDRPTVVELYVIKAEAGAGKTVFLRRLAWEASRDAGGLCIYSREYRNVSADAIQELHRVTQERVFLFVDNAADHVSEIVELLTSARRAQIPLTIITAERINAWNIHADRLDQFVSDSFRLRYLNRSEIEDLVRLLEKYDSLGPHLGPMQFEERVSELEERAGRQLLVALHEATMGVPFEEILLDEYNEIQPLAARSLYLTVCVLNRLGAVVRAGLIARVHGIAFEDFKQHFFAPLQHVVQVRTNSTTGDYHYTARHSQIAQIVFERALRSPIDRYNEYIRILRELNPLYSSDRTALRGLLRARSLMDLFSERGTVQSIFAVADKAVGERAYLLQQMANYERLQPDGDHERAYELLQQARELEPRNTTIVHTLAELARARAERAAKPLEKERFRAEARKLLAPLTLDSQDGRYARHTLVKLATDSLRDLLQSDDPLDSEIDRAVRSVEDQLLRANQQYPNDEYLLAEEARFSGMLKDHERAFNALRRAFEANPRDPYISSRLARSYEGKGDLRSAERTLHAALESAPGDKRLNYRYATVLRHMGESDADRLAYYFRRGFTTGDNNHEAQFWYARYAFETADEKRREEVKAIFRTLRDIPMPHDRRVEVQDLLQDNGRPTVFTGTITRIADKHAFVQRDGPGDYLFLHRDNYAGAEWERLRVWSRVAFNIGFSFSGVKALNAQPI